MHQFKDRSEAGTILATYLKEFAHQKNIIILALPRGGVPVAYEIATALFLPLDICLVRKLGLPGHEEYAMGAIAFGGTVIFNESIISILNLEQDAIDRVLKAEQKELIRREHLYRGNRPFPDLLGKTIILVDDGIATGFSMRAAVEALKQDKAAAIIIAVPVASSSTCDEMMTLGAVDN
jgi:predicted phosphoribosyltransferase